MSETTSTEGGGGTATLEADPTGMGSWMKSIGPLEGTPEHRDPALTRKEPENGTPAAVIKPGENAAGSPATDKNATGDVQHSAADSNAANADTAAKAKAESEAKAAAAKAEAKPDPEEEEDKWPRSGNDWQKFKAKRDQKLQALQKEIQTRETRITEFESKLKDLEAKASATGESPELKAKLERLTKEHAEMSERLQVLDVTQHPKFQAYFAEANKRQIDMAKAIVGQDKAADFEKALALPEGEYRDRQIEELVSDLPMIQQSRIGAVLNNLDSIKQEREAEIRKAGEHKTVLATQAQEKEKQGAAVREKVFADVIKLAQDPKEGMFIYQKQPDNEAWNRGVDERIATARKLLSGDGLKPQDIVKAALEATALPMVLQSYHAEKKAYTEKITSLEQQVAKLTAVQPQKGNSAQANPGETQTRTELKPGMNPMEAAGAFMSKLWTE